MRRWIAVLMWLTRHRQAEVVSVILPVAVQGVVNVVMIQIYRGLSLRWKRFFWSDVYPILPELIQDVCFVVIREYGHVG